MVAAHLRQVLLCGELKTYGNRIGGTYFGATIVLNCGHSDPVVPVEFLVETLHEEFSSIVLRSNGFDEEGWVSASPEGVGHYYPTARNPFRFGSAMFLGGGEHVWAEGFVSTYGKTNLENDFNSYVRLLFGRPDEMRRLATRYPRVRRKLVWCLDYLERVGYAAPGNPTLDAFDDLRRAARSGESRGQAQASLHPEGSEPTPGRAVRRVKR